MKVADLIRFRSDLFFDGAVQLLWADDQVNRANEAARSFVFHGPRYHGASREVQTEEIYRLTDTATLAADLLTRIADGSTTSANPFSLAIAGYGSGKSHFALALTCLLRDPLSELSQQILSNLTLAESRAAEAARKALRTIDKPALVIALDGTGNFNLGYELSASLYRNLKEHDVDDRALRELSPRFDDAASFVKRNYELRTSEFHGRLPGKSLQYIVESLEARDENTYSIVDELYFEANGAHIPVSGRESIQDLISVFCETYCSEGGPFSRLVIVFDEFGRFLEYVAERPALAGDSALQQIFQGIQDNASRAHFLGFIQYELKAYLARLGNRDAMHIQKYITRFDVAKKYYVSSNLETIIAHLLEKKDETTLENALTQTRLSNQSLHAIMAALLPGLKQLPVWNDADEFERVIVRGCWPLHPLATWFLTRQQDIVQSRSAITFVKHAVDTSLTRDANEEGKLVTIPASQILSGDMLIEMLAAERAHGGVTVDNLMAALAKYDAQLEGFERALLVSIAAAKKMRVVSNERGVYDQLLAEFVGQPIDKCNQHLSRLEQELGVIAWSRELKQYEIVSDAATRGQYQKDLRSRLATVTPTDVSEIFISRAKAWSDKLFDDIPTTFGQERDIPTLEWTFTAQLTNEQRVASAVNNAFADWRQAVKPDQAKGQILYSLVGPDTDMISLQTRLQAIYRAELAKSGAVGAPVWTVLMLDRSRRIEQYLATLYVLDERFDKNEQERYARFIPEEREIAKQGLQSALRDAIKDRSSLVAGVEVPAGRLAVEASAIFNLVYPKAPPFPFDGLHTRGGNGNADVAVISRALFGGEVSSSWLAVQQVKLQNRVRTVLRDSWGTLSTDGSVKPVADNPLVTELLETFEKAHKANPQRTLGDDLTMLTRPPIGCSWASASLLLALFIGKPLPPRAIQYQNEGISLKEWLEAAYGPTGKYPLETALQKTTVVFLTEDALTRWKVFFATWEAEATLEGNVSRLREAERMRSHDPLPEQLEANFKFLRHRALEDQEELNAHTQLLQEAEKRLERAIQQTHVHEILAVADRYLLRRKDMAVHPKKWTAGQTKEIESNCEQIADLARAAAPRWITAQACNSSEQIADFRSRMSRAQRTLEGLGIKDLAHVAEQHTVAMIARVKERYQYETTLNDAANLIRTSVPLASTPLREVYDRIEKAEALIGILSEALKSLTKADDVEELIKQLQAKQKSWRQFRSERQQHYFELLNLTPTTTQDARDALYRLSLVGQQFLNTKDAGNIQRRIASCTAVVELLSELDDISGSADDIAIILNKAYASSAKHISEGAHPEVEDEQHEEDEWMESCFAKYVAGREALLKQRSSMWAAAAIEELITLCTKPEQLLAEGVPAKFLSLPALLSEADRARILPEIETLSVTINHAIEQARARKSAAWLEARQEQAVELDTLSELACADILSALRDSPPYVLPNELDQVVELQKRVQRRLDELDISDLVARIKAMPAEKRALLMQELSKTGQEAA
ncbi:hypothetical protein [Paraburkholderia atlantica]|uniref:hypothetical protein n=1 Tax=Paraburkholderia atlantica TaxID=2654982 RepID=UPI00161CF63F|nr:hypothetical protein [Paraburkholderia atlantica]MBB5509522.1 hypothetical protein [Paraburkholderia atlantica]